MDFFMASTWKKMTQRHGFRGGRLETSKNMLVLVRSVNNLRGE